MPPKAGPSKAEKAAKQKKIEDKTFGLKNKNKSKTVKEFVKQAQAGDQLTKEDIRRNKLQADRDRERMAQAERDAIFKPVVVIKQKEAPVGADPKSILCAFFKEGKCTKGSKCKFSHDLNVERKAVKISVFADKRDDIYKDQEALEKAIADREGGQGKRCSTDIICKHFIDAVERRQYGWIWVCPNGGDKCQYRHALPAGYKLKSELDAEKLLAQDAGPSIEDEIEEQRAQLKMRTPLTYEVFLEWRARKKREMAEKEEAAMAAAKEARAKGKAVHNLTGRALFQFDPTLFKDDANAGGNDAFLDAYRAKRVKDDEDDDEEETDYGRAAAAPLYDASRQAEPSSDEEEEEEEEAEEVEWFCDGCDGDILTDTRFDCQECEDEFCYCEACHADPGKAHEHAMVRMPRAKAHASSQRGQAWLAKAASASGGAAGSGAPPLVDESLFDDDD